MHVECGAGGHWHYGKKILTEGYQWYLNILDLALLHLVFAVWWEFWEVCYQTVFENRVDRKHLWSRHQMLLASKEILLSKEGIFSQERWSKKLLYHTLSFLLHVNEGRVSNDSVSVITSLIQHLNSTEVLSHTWKHSVLSWSCWSSMFNLKKKKIS